MKKLLLLLALAFFAAHASALTPNLAPETFPEIKLNTGKVIRDVQIRSVGAADAIVFCREGLMSVSLSALPPDTLVAFRNWSPPSASPRIEVGRATGIEGPAPVSRSVSLVAVPPPTPLGATLVQADRSAVVSPDDSPKSDASAGVIAADAKPDAQGTPLVLGAPLPIVDQPLSPDLAEATPNGVDPLAPLVFADTGEVRAYSQAEFDAVALQLKRAESDLDGARETNSHFSEAARIATTRHDDAAKLARQKNEEWLERSAALRVELKEAQDTGARLDVLRAGLDRDLQSSRAAALPLAARIRSIEGDLKAAQDSTIPLAERIQGLGRDLKLAQAATALISEGNRSLEIDLKAAQEACAQVNDAKRALEREHASVLASFRSEVAALKSENTALKSENIAVKSEGAARVARFSRPMGSTVQATSASRSAVVVAGNSAGATSGPSTVLPVGAGAREARAHTVADGDSLSRLSQRYYGSPDRWADIYGANLEKLKGSEALKVGSLLLIP